ncbi:hypothetical protein BSKO_08018 [Bryopsis sp. KO-2023]|nr:hypothetical protein BSKO_08018 [Bryopsis sp. KO-2023]
MATFKDLSTPDGLAELNDYLLTRSYISGYQASRDDLAVFSAMGSAPSASSYPHAARWYKHIKALLGASFPGAGAGVTIAGASTGAAAAAVEEEEDEEEVKDVMEDSDEDMDLFGEMTEEEKKADAERKAAIAAKLAKSKANAAKAKSMIIIDVKPWDDETVMADLEKNVRSVEKDGLFWGQSKFVPVGFGIKKLQITAVIEDAKVESFDEIIEDYLVKDGESDFIQSVDIVAFNKI